MNGDKILMSRKERRRLYLLTLVQEERLTLVAAAEKMSISYRQAKRLKRRLQDDGARGLVHGNRGRHPPNRLSDEIRSRIVALGQEKYALFNDCHFTEMLEELEKIRVSRETVRQLLRGAGRGPKRKRKARRHYRRRPRKEQAGLMMLWDGSPHHWFGDQEPPCCLMAAMDDATGDLLAAKFFEQECSAGYLWLLDRVVRCYGIPQSAYQDRHSALRRNDDHWSHEEQLRGRRDPTQVGAALEALGIEPIYALTPQAKGRVERLFGTLQDRLCAEMVHKGIRDLRSGNRFVINGFRKRFNRRFAVPAANSESAYLMVPPDIDLSREISFRYRRSVGNDNTVRLGSLSIEIPGNRFRRTYARARVAVHQLLDGSWRVYHKDKLIARHKRTPLREPRKIQGRRKKALKGIRETLWIYLASKP
jgi:transposase